MEKGANECLAAALTLLTLNGIMNVEEVTKATKTGYGEVFDLLNQKYRELKATKE